ARRSAAAAPRRQSRRLLDRARGRESLPVPRLECRARPAGVAARARDAGGSRQVRRELLAAAPAASAALPGGAAPHAVRAYADRSAPGARAGGAVSRGESLCGKILPAAREVAVARRGRCGGGGRERGARGAEEILSADACAQARAHRASVLVLIDRKSVVEGKSGGCGGGRIGGKKSRW